MIIIGDDDEEEEDTRQPITFGVSKIDGDIKDKVSGLGVHNSLLRQVVSKSTLAALDLSDGAIDGKGSALIGGRAELNDKKGSGRAASEAAGGSLVSPKAAKPRGTVSWADQHGEGNLCNHVVYTYEDKLDAKIYHK